MASHVGEIMKLKLVVIAAILSILTACSSNISKESLAATYAACENLGGVKLVTTTIDPALDVNVTGVECEDGTIIELAE